MTLQYYKLGIVKPADLQLMEDTAIGIFQCNPNQLKNERKATWMPIIGHLTNRNRQSFEHLIKLVLS